MSSKARASSSSASSPASSPTASAASLSPSNPSSPSLRTTEQPSTPIRIPQRPSLLSSSVSKVEHSNFELGMRDGSPRLITCVKASQGFDWNLDIFIPSHCEISVPSLTDQPDPVHEIFITEEDTRMFEEQFGFSP